METLFTQSRRVDLFWSLRTAFTPKSFDLKMFPLQYFGVCSVVSPMLEKAKLGFGVWKQAWSRYS